LIYVIVHTYGDNALLLYILMNNKSMEMNQYYEI